MKCPNCGQMAEEGTRYCKNCGAHVVVPPQSPAMPPGNDPVREIDASTVMHTAQSAMRFAVAPLLLATAIVFLPFLVSTSTLDYTPRRIIFLLVLLVSAFCGVRAYMLANRSLHLARQINLTSSPAISRARWAELLGTIGASLSILSILLLLFLWDLKA